jgi:intein-encoded DNA endonuclease-like protein
LPVKKFIKSGGFAENSPMCTIRVYSKKIINDLVNIGLTPNKSLTVKFPKIEKEFLHHFIRGYFDGNGSISIDKTKNLVRVKFTSGSNDFIVALQNILNDLEIKTTYMHPKENTYELGIPNKFSTRKFLEYIYDDSNVYLERKHDFYLKHKDLLIYLYDGWNKR